MLYGASFIENLSNINLALLQIVFFPVSGETKELSDERSSIGLVLWRHTSNTWTIIFCISILFIFIFIYMYINYSVNVFIIYLLFIIYYYYYYHFYVIGRINYLCISCNAMLDVLCMF